MTEITAQDVMRMKQLWQQVQSAIRLGVSVDDDGRVDASEYIQFITQGTALAGLLYSFTRIPGAFDGLQAVADVMQITVPGFEDVF